MGQIDLSTGAKPRCLTCQHLLDGYSTIGEEDCAPVEGDFSVCFYCGTISVYTKDFSLRPLTKAETDFINSDMQLHKELSKIVGLIKQRIKQQ